MGMLSGWLRGAIGLFLLREARATLSAIRAMPHDSQRMVADVVGRMVVEALDEIEGERSRSEVLDEYLVSAVALRHHAVENGAESRSSPQWACAALAENLFMAVHPRAARSVARRVTEWVDAWARSLLSPAELERLGFTRLGELAWRAPPLP